MFEKSYTLYDAIYCSLKNYKSEAEKIKEIIFSYIPNAKSILDIACGTGEHHKYLKNKFNIDGIDINKNFIEIAQRKNKDVSYYCHTMSDFNLNKRYDVILCLFTSIGYLLNYEQLKNTILNFSNHLNPNGLIIIEPWVVPEQWQSGSISVQTFDKESLKICRMAQCKTEGKISKIDFHFMVGTTEKIHYFSEKHELQHFSFGEMKNAFDECDVEISFDPVGLTNRGLYLGSLRPDRLDFVLKDISADSNATVS